MTKEEEQMQVPLLKAMEIAEMLNISRAMAYRLMQLGDIPSIRIGNSLRVKMVDLYKYLENQRSSMTIRGR